MKIDKADRKRSPYKLSGSDIYRSRFHWALLLDKTELSRVTCWFTSGALRHLTMAKPDLPNRYS